MSLGYYYDIKANNSTQLDKVRFRMHNTNARVRKIENDLTLEEYVAISHQACHYCGDSPALGIDRINSKLGYVEGNMLPACGICNRAKHMLTIDEFNMWIDRITAHRKCKGVY